MGTYFAVFSNFGARTQIGAQFDVAADTLAAPRGTPINRSAARKLEYSTTHAETRPQAIACFVCAALRELRIAEASADRSTTCYAMRILDERS
jgi:hypothetical protein